MSQCASEVGGAWSKGESSWRCGGNSIGSTTGGPASAMWRIVRAWRSFLQQMQMLGYRGAFSTCSHCELSFARESRCACLAEVKASAGFALVCTHMHGQNMPSVGQPH